MEVSGSINEQDLRTAVHMLQALRDPTRSDHVHALKSLETNVIQPSFILHILHIFAHGSSIGLSADIRQLAGLIIKNYVFPHLIQLPEMLQVHLKREFMNILHDPLLDLRKTAAILIGKISESFMINFWVDMLPPILDALTMEQFQSNYYFFDGCLYAINRICEDSAVKLSLDESIRPLEVLIPKLLLLFQCNDAQVRIRALESYNCLLYLLEGPSSIAVGGLRSRNTSYDSNVDSNSVTSNANKVINHPVANISHPLIVNMHRFIESLSVLAQDVNPTVRKCICQSISTIACLQISLLEAYFGNICEFMLITLMDSDESVAMESCEYWNALLHTPDTKRAMLPYLKRLIESLITRLYLTNDQMETERIEEEEEESGERALNIQPLFHRAQMNNNNNNNANSSQNSPNGGGGGGNQTTSEEMKENNELSSKWTLRKQAALSLDIIAMSFPPKDILQAALPKIQACFENDQVLIKESGMLALGALSSGCLEEMAMYIPQLFPFIIANLKNSLPEMRSISCWVLSRYCRLFGDRSVTNTFSEELGIQFYNLTLQEFVNTMFDKKSKVQVAACSAICLLVENSFIIPVPSDSNSQQTQTGQQQNILISNLQTLLSAISHAFDFYGIKASLILIDLIGTVADTLGSEIKPFTATFLPKLMNKFLSFEDFDTRMFPVLECFTSVLPVVGLEAQEYLATIYQRCIRILIAVLVAPQHQQQQLQQHSALHQNTISPNKTNNPQNPTHPDDINKDFAVCAMDVISAINEGLGGMFMNVILQNQNNNNNTHTNDQKPSADAQYNSDLLLQLLFLGLKDPELPELRQSSFSLAGELIKNCFLLIMNHPQGRQLIHDLLQTAAINLDSSYPLVCNNAAWMIGELSIQVAPDVLHYFIPDIMNGLIFALQTSDLSDNLKVNIAITIGRLAIKCPFEVAEVADECFAAWCSVLSFPCPYLEKCQAFYGLLSVLHQHIDVIIGNKTNIYSLLIAAISWQQNSEGEPAGPNELPPMDIIMGLSQVFHHVKQQDEALWNKVLKTFSNSYSVDYFKQLYQI
jgi:hypothetical protein